jgi:hypothetical protein
VDLLPESSNLPSEKKKKWRTKKLLLLSPVRVYKSCLISFLKQLILRIFSRGFTTRKLKPAFRKKEKMEDKEINIIESSDDEDNVPNVGSYELILPGKTQSMASAYFYGMVEEGKTDASCF